LGDRKNNGGFLGEFDGGGCLADREHGQTVVHGTKWPVELTVTGIMEDAPGMETTQQSTLDLARTRGLLRPLDLAAHGLPRVFLTRLVRQGRLARVGRAL